MPTPAPSHNPGLHSGFGGAASAGGPRRRQCIRCPATSAGVCRVRSPPGLLRSGGEGLVGSPSFLDSRSGAWGESMGLHSGIRRSMHTSAGVLRRIQDPAGQEYLSGGSPPESVHPWPGYLSGRLPGAEPAQPSLQLQGGLGGRPAFSGLRVLDAPGGIEALLFWTPRRERGGNRWACTRGSAGHAYLS